MGAILTPSLDGGFFDLVIQEDYEYLSIVALATSALFMTGAVFYSDTLRAAAVLLALAIAGRALLELRLSLLKQLNSTGELNTPESVLGLAVIYTFNFIAPSLLLIDAVRGARGNRARLNSPN
jgi:hypothetical protein